MIDEFFVMPSYRKGQREAIAFAAEAFDKGKKFVVIECPTGGGKSAIGMTLARMNRNAFYITATKLLQDQLNRDFSSLMVNLKGRNAYPCTIMDRQGDKFVRNKVWSLEMLADARIKHQDCASGFCRVKSSKPFGGDGSKCKLCFPVERGGDLSRLPEGMKHSACPYYEQVYTALDAPIVSMNFSSYLYQTTMSKRFDKRGLMVVDECHNVESQLLDFVSVVISSDFLDLLGVTFPPMQTAADIALWMIENDFIAIIDNATKKALIDDDAKSVDELSKMRKRITVFLDDMSLPSSRWVLMITDAGHVLKPVFVKSFAKTLLFDNAERILLMSATVLNVDVFCDSLGIDPSEVAAYKMKNRFPVVNRPIYYKPVDKLVGGKQGMDKWGPKLVTGVEKIAESYQHKRGIIHTHNNAIAKLLAESCKYDVRKRFILSSDYKDKSTLLLEHERYDDSIIVAPAFHEGVDLRDDLSRFQIICKVPFANFYDDVQLAERIKNDNDFYKWMTALKLVQSYGRSVRNETDYADTYVLDEAFERFCRDAKRLLPSWFLEAIKW
jgi:ATP-dependent DNA helicase DinG